MTLLNLLAEINGNLTGAIAAVGATIGIGLIGSKAAESTGRNPSASGKVLAISIVLAALIEGALIIALLLGAK